MFRRGQRDLAVTIAEIEPDKVATKTADKEERAKSSNAGQHVGLVVRDLTDAQKRELKLKGGVVVTAASEGAARGFARGDIILALANSEVLSVKDFEAVLGKVDKSKTLSVLVPPGNGPSTP